MLFSKTSNWLNFLLNRCTFVTEITFIDCESPLTIPVVTERVENYMYYYVIPCFTFKSETSNITHDAFLSQTYFSSLGSWDSYCLGLQLYLLTLPPCVLSTSRMVLVTLPWATRQWPNNHHHCFLCKHMSLKRC